LRFLADNIPVYNLENDRSYSDSYTSVEWMRKSEPRYLRQLAEIIDLGSLSLAAKSLNVSQPTLSRNIKSLEALIGAPVLRRGRYGVTPTHIGAALGREGRAIREALRQAELDLGRWKGGLDG
jgi:DNA-binding transcriptional LysR family regulator